MSCSNNTAYCHSSRVAWIDMAKGIGILLMVWGHTEDGFFTHWLYYFHMPLFMFLAGFVFNVKDGYVEFIKKRARTLLIPYAVFFVIGFFIQWLYEFVCYSSHPLIPTFFHKIKELLVPIWGTGVTTGLWFLIALMELNLVVGILVWKKMPAMGICLIALLCSIASYLLRTKAILPFFITPTAVLSVYFVAGIVWKKYHQYVSENRINKVSVSLIGGYFNNLHMLFS